MNKKYAVIDFGTNTFHLLIAVAKQDRGFDILNKDSSYVHLAENGLSSISESAFHRALETAVRFRNLMDQNGVLQYRATATAAMRTASNGPMLAAAIAEQACILPEIISGEREAELIALGVLQVVPVAERRWLVMDIGGGSVEFIIGVKNMILYKESFPIGVGVLKHKFSHQHPVEESEREEIKSFITSHCNSLIDALDMQKPEILIGASGTFDVLATYIPAKKINEWCVELHAGKLQECFHEVYEANWQTLERIHWVPEERRRLIASAFCLIEFILGAHQFRAIFTSAFAIKEGLLLEMISEDN